MHIKADYSDIAFRNNGRHKLLIIIGTHPEVTRLAAEINKSRRSCNTPTLISSL